MHRPRDPLGHTMFQPSVNASYPQDAELRRVIHRALLRSHTNPSTLLSRATTAEPGIQYLHSEHPTHLRSRRHQRRPRGASFGTSRRSPSHRQRDPRTPVSTAPAGPGHVHAPTACAADPTVVGALFPTPIAHEPIDPASARHHWGARHPFLHGEPPPDGPLDDIGGAPVAQASARRGARPHTVDTTPERRSARPLRDQITCTRQRHAQPASLPSVRPSPQRSRHPNAQPAELPRRRALHHPGIATRVRRPAGAPRAGSPSTLR